MDSQHKSTQSMSELLIHKEKKQKKNNKTSGQIDNLRGYHNDNQSASGQLANQPTSDKLIRREANYMKNIHIDSTYERLKSVGLVMDDKYKAFWCGAIHKLGVAFVTAQADIALNKGNNPAALFHFLINKQLNEKQDPFMPRFN